MKEYFLRDRDDGQFEVVELVPVMLGVFPERDMALAFMRFLRSEAKAGGDQVSRTALIETRQVDRPRTMEAAPLDLPAAEPVVMPNVGDAPVPPVQLPAVVAPAAAVAFLTRIADAHAPMQEAFDRIEAGERIAVIAPEYGLTLNQLRGRWAAYVKNRQDRMGGDKQIDCQVCGRAFTPSVTNMDTCARCSRD